MFKQILPVLKLGALLLTLILAIIAVLYICDFFTGEEIKRLITKSMAIIAIVTAFFTFAVLLAKEK